MYLPIYNMDTMKGYDKTKMKTDAGVKSVYRKKFEK